ncbi:MAG: hypothetical protein ACLR8Y_00295 [Alistipes indistinctus]
MLLVKLLDVLLADLAVAADKNVIGIFDAADVLSRNARIGFPDRDLLAGLDRLDGSFDALGNQFDVLDLAADDALHGEISQSMMRTLPPSPRVPTTVATVLVPKSIATT